MKTIKPFIKLGWHTVPLKGELKRLSNGKKNVPNFPKNWNSKYRDEFNETATELGGAITGKVSGIIAIDCDNTETWQMFRALDPSYEFVFKSLGKKDALGNDLEAGTIIYKYDDAFGDSYKLHNDFISLDLLSDGAFTYLPTDANSTKATFELTELKEAPKSIIALVNSLRPVRISSSDQVIKNKVWKSNLAPQVERFVKIKKVTAELFKVLTPKDFRTLPEYIDKGFLHPDDVPDGAGSDYLSKVSAILGADESIDEQLYLDAMKTINGLFSQPMPTSRLHTTVIEPMVEERAQINGEPIWQYDENWQEEKLSFITKRNNQVECFYDYNRLRYYVADVIAENVKSFSRDSDFFSFIETIALEAPSKKESKARLPLVDVVSSPAYPFGFFNDAGQESLFNTFSPTIPLQVFKDPKSYAKHYKYPKTILRYLESLIPDNYMRNYLLKFLRRKFDKFEYSPTILYLLGVSGAGKDTLVQIIEKLIGVSSMSRPTVREFLEMYNGWMLDKYFAQLDEYGNQLTRFDEKESALGKIKAYTGKKEVQIRQMRADGFNYIHHITFIMTANKNPLFLDHDDRRVALFDCPNILREEQWVLEEGGVSRVIEQIDNEITDFAYYLSTELDNLTLDEYMTPPETADKRKLIASKLNAGMRIAYMLTCQLFTELEELARENEVEGLFDGAPEGRLYEEELFDLYYEMTDGKGTKRGLTTAMKEFDKVPTTRNAQKSYYYNIPSLRGYKLAAMSPIEQEGDMDV